MKFIKNPVITFILGAIIFSSIAVLATTTINAHYITYTDKNNVDKPVDEVLDDLYTKAILDFYTADYSTSSGHAISSRSTSVNVTKGKYLIVRNETTAWADGASVTFNNGSDATTKTLSCSSNNCTVRQISGYYNNQDSGSFGGYKFMVSNAVNLFYVEINEDTDVITASTGAGASDTSVQYVTLEAAKLK